MSLAANKALAQRWFEEVWNQGRESTIDELFHPQGKAYGFPERDSVLVGPEAFKNIHRKFHTAFGKILSSSAARSRRTPNDLAFCPKLTDGLLVSLLGAGLY